ncbi:MAG TPA: acyl carrier protein [Clostridiaceae bacterium]|nr:acyl carrier protein [Clostridiaceae bacterium]
MDKLLEILEDLNPDVDYKIEKKLIDDGIIDSFDVISLVADIDDEFGVSISADELVPENFNSIEAIWQLIEKHKAN